MNNPLSNMLTTLLSQLEGYTAMLAKDPDNEFLKKIIWDLLNQIEVWKLKLFNNGLLEEAEKATERQKKIEERLREITDIKRSSKPKGPGF